MSEAPRAEQGASIPFSLPAALVSLAFMVTACLVWYANRDQWWGKSNGVVLVYTIGAGIFFAALCLHRRVSLRSLSRETVVVALTSLLFMALLWHFGRRHSYPFSLPRHKEGLEHLYSFFYLSACCVFARMLLPLAMGKWVLGRGPRDYGYRTDRMWQGWWMYALILLAAIPMVWYASTLPAFVRKYPLCRSAIDGSTLELYIFVIYHLAYALVFVSGEAFWRGYILFGLERQLGANALFFMIIPYTAIHFGKPQPEAMGAIAAGLLLGAMALRHRSFWLGALLHWGVAFAMDCFAIWRRGVEFVL